MIAATGWLDVTTDRPPLPRREKTPLYEQAVAAAALIQADREARESTAVLYRVEELNRVLDPKWPVVEPVNDGTVPSMPRFVARRFSWRWCKARLTWHRQVAGGMSGLVLLATLLGWVNQ